MMSFWQDMWYAGRRFRKSRGFTAIALITLAMGIGTNTIMFSISDLLLLRPKNVQAPEQLVFCAIKDAKDSWFRYSAYRTLCDSRLAFSDVMAQWWGDLETATLVHGDSAWEVPTTYVSANYFSFLGITPVLGRGFLPEEEQYGGAHVVVLSHRLWRRLGADPKIVGQFMSLSGIRCQVVGVAPKGFTGVTLIGPDLWLPLGNCLTVAKFYRGRTRLADTSADRDYPLLAVVGRLQPNVTIPAAQSQLQSLVPRFKQEYPENWKGDPSFKLHPPGRLVIGGDSEQLRLMMTLFSLALMAASVIILVVACLNLGSMLIVQGASRRREIAVRLAVGGGRWRIIRQLLTESLLLALLGGVLGFLLAFCCIRILNAWIGAAPEWVRDLRPGLNIRVLAVTLGFSLIATLLFGLKPALCLSRHNIMGELKASAGSVLGSFHRKRGRFSVLGQITLAVALVLSAALLTRSALHIARPDPRFPLEDKLIIQVDPMVALRSE